MPKITKQKNKQGSTQLRVTIPYEIAKKLNLQAGDNLIFSIQMNNQIALQHIKKS